LWAIRGWSSNLDLLDRLDLGAVLFGLAAALHLLDAVELGLDAVDLAVEQVDERLQQIGEIGFEPGAGQHRVEGLDHGLELAAGSFVVGQWPEIGARPRPAMAIERQLGEEMRGR
jgi:hypothetical protein